MLASIAYVHTHCPMQSSHLTLSAWLSTLKRRWSGEAFLNGLHEHGFGDHIGDNGKYHEHYYNNIMGYILGIILLGLLVVGLLRCGCVQNGG